MDIKKLSQFLVVMGGIIGLFVTTLTFGIVVQNFSPSSIFYWKKVALEEQQRKSSEPTPVVLPPISGALNEAVVKVVSIVEGGMNVEVERLNNKPVFIIWDKSTTWRMMDSSEPTPIAVSGSGEVPRRKEIKIKSTDVTVGDRIIVDINGDFQVDAQQYLATKVVKFK
jgi:hypothetical protein